jgi:hypothetical protein
MQQNVEILSAGPSFRRFDDKNSAVRCDRVISQLGIGLPKIAVMDHFGRSRHGGILQ